MKWSFPKIMTIGLVIGLSFGPTGSFLSTAPSSADAQGVKSMNYIDAHVHVWTPDTVRYPLASGFTKENMKPALFTPEELFKHCKPPGVGRINLIQMSFYGFDNSYMLDMIAKYPGVFVGTAVIDPLGPDPACEMNELAKRGVRAFRIHPKLTEQPIDKWLRPDGYKKMFATGAIWPVDKTMRVDLRTRTE